MSEHRGTETFTTDDKWTVPTDVHRLFVELTGGAGRSGDAIEWDADDSGGEGGFVKGELPVTEGENLEIRNRYGGGIGHQEGGDGGDACDIRQGGDTLSDRVVVAAGGGGGGISDNNPPSGDVSGGDGGPDTGEEGESTTNAPEGKGGTQDSGGSSDRGDDGGFGYGGDSHNIHHGAGGGGSGWYGGGGGSEDNDSDTYRGGGGGGGSNYVGGLSVVETNARGGSTGTGTSVEFDWFKVPEIPPNPNASVTAENDISLTWDAADNAEEYDVYRATSAGVDTSGSPHATTGTTDYEDSGVDEGRTYYYRIVALNGPESSDDSTEVSTTTDGPAPSDVVLSVVDNNTWDATWTLNSTDEDEVRLEVEQAESAVWETEATLPAGAESYTKDDTLDGEWYRARVVAVFTDTETESDPSDPIVTDLPAVVNLDATAQNLE